MDETDGPEDLTLRHMRDIRAKLDEHDKRFDKLEKRFDKIDKTLEDLRYRLTCSLGLGTSTHLRVNELDALSGRSGSLIKAHGRHDRRVGAAHEAG